MEIVRLFGALSTEFTRPVADLPPPHVFG